MEIFDSEKSIETLIQASTSVLAESTYVIDEDVDASALLTEIDYRPEPEDELAYAAFTKDIKPISSILVSDIWNMNDDVFTSDELIAAYKTPQYKPINWMHKGSETRGNENIGVMVKPSLVKGSIGKLKYFDNEDNKKLSKTRTSGSVHIKVDGVIWAAYFPSYSNEITVGLENNELYVSMEAFFDGFGYALRESSNDDPIFIERNKETAYMSKSLKALGGNGKIKYGGKNHQIGRWLKGITFSGKGIVYNPANSIGNKKLSIVFSKHHKEPSKSVDNSSIKANLGIIHENYPTGNKNMSETLQAQYDELQTKYDEAIKTIANLKDSAMASQLEKIKEEKAEVEAKLAEVNTKVEELSSAATSVESLNEKITELTEANDKLSTELGEIKSIETARVRLDELKGLSDTYSDEDLDSVKAMSDDTFTAVKAALVKAGVSSETKSTDAGKVGKAPASTDVGSNTSLTNSTDASADVNEATDAIDEAKAEADADLVVSSDTDKITDTKEAARNLVGFAISSRR